MRAWYFNIPSGEYTIRELMRLANPPQKYECVKSQLVRFKVKNYRRDKKLSEYNQRNEKVWIWRGAEYYLTISVVQQEKENVQNISNI